MSSAEAIRSGPAQILFPRLHEAGDAQVRDAEPNQPRLGLGAAAGRALVPDLPARPGRGTGKRRDRGRVIVGLNLHAGCRSARRGQHMPRRRAPRTIVGPASPRSPRRCRDTPRARPAGCSRCVLRIIPNSDFSLAPAVDDPIGVEYLVTAVLGVRLREHHELDVRRVAGHASRRPRPGSRSRRRTARARESSSPRTERRAIPPGERHVATGRGSACANSAAAAAVSVTRRLGHAVVQQCARRGEFGCRGRPVRCADSRRRRARCGEPRRGRRHAQCRSPCLTRATPSRSAAAQAGARPAGAVGRARGAIGEQRLEHRGLCRRQRTLDVHEMQVSGIEPRRRPRPAREIEDSSLASRKSESAGAPVVSAFGAATRGFWQGREMIPDRPGRTSAWPTCCASPGPRRVNRIRELRDVRTFDRGHLAHAGLAHLVDANHRMQRQIGAFHPGELRLDLLLGRIDDHRGALAEDEFLDFDKTEQRAVARPCGRRSRRSGPGCEK